MFTGIIESLGEVISVKEAGTNLHIRIESPISRELKIDQSVSHNGVCLTVIEVEQSYHGVMIVQETLEKSNLKAIKKGDKINLERSMLANGRFDGHIVQGHVDQTGIVKAIIDANGSWLFDFEYNPGLENVTVEKGSICVNGVSLTCFNSSDGAFRVAVIPYTFEHTSFYKLSVGDEVNLEFDIIGKYVKRLLIKSGRT